MLLQESSLQHVQIEIESMIDKIRSMLWYYVWIVEMQSLFQATARIHHYNDKLMKNCK